jgi:hypothetical protein
MHIFNSVDRCDGAVEDQRGIANLIELNVLLLAFVAKHE